MELAVKKVLFLGVLLVVLWASSKVRVYREFWKPEQSAWFLCVDGVWEFEDYGESVYASCAPGALPLVDTGVTGTDHRLWRHGYSGYFRCTGGFDREIYGQSLYLECRPPD